MIQFGINRYLRWLAVLALAASLQLSSGKAEEFQILPASSQVESTESPYRSLAAARANPFSAEEEPLLDPGEFGCLIGGAIGGIALFADPNALSLFVGETLVATWPAAVYAALGGALVASVCTVVQAVSPLAIYLYRRYVSSPDRLEVDRPRLGSISQFDPGQ